MTRWTAEEAAINASFSHKFENVGPFDGVVKAIRVQPSLPETAFEDTSVLNSTFIHNKAGIETADGFHLMVAGMDASDVIAVWSGTRYWASCIKRIRSKGPAWIRNFDLRPNNTLEPGNVDGIILDGSGTHWQDVTNPYYSGSKILTSFNRLRDGRISTQHNTCFDCKENSYCLRVTFDASLFTSGECIKHWGATENIYAHCHFVIPESSNAHLIWVVNAGQITKFYECTFEYPGGLITKTPDPAFVKIQDPNTMSMAQVIVINQPPPFLQELWFTAQTA